ncbi:MAG: DedA family protein [Ginsengibacter sp.]
MELIDFILHIDQHLNAFIIEYNNWVYAILFAIVFIETGLVIMPFLPGDSLLFAVGMFAAQGSMDISIAIAVLLTAAILGDGCNYFVGKYVGHRILEWKLFGRKLVKPEHLEKTHQFYEKHGAKTIIIARFVPFVRTFAPFVAGVGSMSYKTFTSYNIIGAIVWVVGICLIGFFLGNNEFVKANFEKVVFLIIFVSVLPVIIAFVKARIDSKKEKQVASK